MTISNKEVMKISEHEQENSTNRLKETSRLS